MPPVGDEQRRHETAARFETLRLQPPPPPTAPTLNNNNLVPVSMDYPALGNIVLTEILLRLPAKCVIRFKSVCKNWRSLISSDQFYHRHTLRHHKLQSSLILEMYSGEFFYFNPSLTTISVAIKMAPKLNQACNGLLLLESQSHLGTSFSFYNPTTRQSHLGTSFSVYNPTTRQSREITPAHNDKYPFVAAINLAYDPLKSPFYKVVCIRCKYNNNKWSMSYAAQAVYQVEVYDSESHTWKLDLDTFTSTRLGSNGVYWNNAIYWRINYDAYHDFYSYFDIETSQFKTTTSSCSFLPCLQKPRNRYLIYDFKLVDDKDEDEDEDELIRKHYHVVCTRPYQGVESFSIVRFMDGKDNGRRWGGDGGWGGGGGWGGDGDDGACGLLTCANNRAHNLNKYYENLIDLGSEWCYDAKAYPLAEILALV